jgi:cobalt/nickel transport system permease protein
MFDQFLEDIAQTNGLREVNTYLKLAAGFGGIILCLLSTSYLPPLFIALLLTGSILALAKVDAKTYAELFVVPFWFALFSVAGIILVSGGSEVFWRWDPLPWLSVSITRESINHGFLVFCRIIGGMSAMCFIALTTPMTDIFIVLRHCRIPEILIDLAMIIYRTIFIILDQVKQIYNAQVMRLGYSTWRESIHSFASMCGAVFIASWNAGEDLIRAMDARCYDGKFALLGETRPVERIPFIAVLVFLSVSSLVVFLSKDMTII